jgi:hypothetical protein
MMDFLEETGFTIEQATGQHDDFPITSAAAHPYEHGKPFIIDGRVHQPTHADARIS